MRITITCEECSRRHRLERAVSEPGAIWIICHDCELPLRAVLEQTVSAVPAAAVISDGFRDTWAGTLDISSSATANS